MYIRSVKKFFKHVKNAFVSYDILYKKNAVVSLTTILIIGTVVMETALVGLAVSYLVGEQGLGVRASYAAMAAAEGGINDALLRIARDKDFSPSPNPYTLTSGLYQATITVTKEVIDARFTRYTVHSVGLAFTKDVSIQGTYIIDGYTGSIRTESYVEGA